MSFIDLPCGVKGMVVPTAEGDYSILINARYNARQRQETYEHEMRHILLGHYQQAQQPVLQLEAEANDPALLTAAIRKAALYGLPAGTLAPNGEEVQKQTQTAPVAADYTLKESHKEDEPGEGAATAAWLPARGLSARLRRARRAQLTGQHR